MPRMTAVLVVLCPALALAEPPKPAADPSGLSGYWKPQSVVSDGVEQFQDSKARDAVVLVVKDGEYRVYIYKDKAKDLGVRLVTAALKADATQKTIELTILDGERKGLKCHGIFEVRDGTLKLCYGPADKLRPATFAAPAGSQLFCETWQAEK
jgi:uncharacterized protein (TIGR03067 family)